MHHLERDARGARPPGQVAVLAPFGTAHWNVHGVLLVVDHDVVEELVAVGRVDREPSRLLPTHAHSDGRRSDCSPESQPVEAALLDHHELDLVRR